MRRRFELGLRGARTKYGIAEDAKITPRCPDSILGNHERCHVFADARHLYPAIEHATLSEGANRSRER